MHEVVIATTATHPSTSSPSEAYTQSSFLQCTLPNVSDHSSSASSLTRENIKQHNALLASHDQISPSDLHKFNTVGSFSTASTPSSSRGLETPTQTDSYPTDNATDNADIEESSPRTLHVHFRPRVRITSGINPHRHPRSLGTKSNYSSVTPASSVSSSPSSSISAPLRPCFDDETDKPRWGPLGRRVALFSRQARFRSERRQRRRKKELRDDPLPPCERTPLLRPRIQSPVIDADGYRRFDEAFDSDPEEDTQKARARQVDEAFGTMPWRLLNYYWWWRQIEPLVCCRCLDEADI